MIGGPVVYYGSKAHGELRRAGKAGMLQTRMAARVRFLVERKVAPAIGRHLIKILKESLRRQTKKTKRRDRKMSVWTQIADGLYAQYRMKGKKTDIIISCKHPAAALKQWGGLIRAGGPYSEASPYHNKVSKLIPIAYPNAPGRLGLQSDLKFHTSELNAWLEGGEHGVADFGGYYDPTRLHSIPLANLLRPSQKAQNKYMKVFAPIRAAMGGVAKAVGKDNWSRYRRLKSLKSMEGSLDSNGKITPNVLRHEDEEFIAWIEGSTGFNLPEAPTGEAGNILMRWMTKAGAAIVKQHGWSTKQQQKSTSRKYEAAKRDFMARTRLVFTMQGRRRITPLYMLVPSWFVPAANGGQGWIPTKSDLRATLLKRLKEGSKLWLAIRQLR